MHKRNIGVVMDSVCSRAVQTTDNLHVQTFLLCCFALIHMARLLLVLVIATVFCNDVSHSLFFSPVSQIFANFLAAISSLAIAWSECDASIGPICCHPKELTLAARKKTKKE